MIVAAAGNAPGHAVGTPANCPGVIAVAGAAPRRHQGRLLRSRARDRDQRARRQLRQHRRRHRLPVPDPDDVQYRHDHAGALDLHRQLQSVARHQLLGAAGRRHGRADAVGAAGADAAAGAAAAAGDGARRSRPPAAINGDGTPVPECTAPQYDLMGRPVDQRECYCTTATCGAGMLDAGAALAAAASGAVASPRCASRTPGSARRDRGRLGAIVDALELELARRAALDPHHQDQAATVGHALPALGHARAPAPRSTRSLPSFQ